MIEFSTIPILACLDRIQVAKLVPEVAMRHFGQGDVVWRVSEPMEWVYFVRMGRVDVGDFTDYGFRRHYSVQTGDIVGEWVLQMDANPPGAVVAMAETELFCVPLPRFKELLAASTHMMKMLTASMVLRNQSMAQEMGIMRRALDTYSEELWSGLEAQPPEEFNDPLPVQEAAVAALSLPQASGIPVSSRFRLVQIDWAACRRPLLLLVGCLLALAVIFLPPHLSWGVRFTLGILVWAGWNWLFELMPDYAVALVAMVATTFANVAAPAVVIGGFANSVWFLLLASLGLGAVVAKSGLLYRLALHMLQRLPPTFWGQSCALILTGILFTPCLPASGGRSAIAAPFAWELAQTMGYRQRSGGAAGLAMTSFLSFGSLYFLFLNGANTSLMAWSILPEHARGKITWGFWVLAAMPAALMMILMFLLGIGLFLRPEKRPPLSRSLVQQQIDILGPLTREEGTVVSILFAVIIGFITVPLHHIDPAWLALLGFLLLIALGHVPKDLLRRGIDWSFLLLIGAIVGVTNSGSQVGFNEVVAGWLSPLLTPLAAYPMLFLGVLALLTFALRLAIPIHQVQLLLCITLNPLAEALGYHPFVIALVVLISGTTCLIPQQNPCLMSVYSGTDGNAFSLPQVRGLAAAHSLMLLVTVMAMVPYWKLLGLIG